MIADGAGDENYLTLNPEDFRAVLNARIWPTAHPSSLERTMFCADTDAATQRRNVEQATERIASSSR